MAEPTAGIEAHFAVAGGRTQMTGCRTKAPLKIAKTFPAGNALGVCVMDASPGLLAGDYYKLAWNLGTETQVAISTQGFTRVHPSRENPCLLQQELRVARGARLEYFPEPLMLYRDASLRAECLVHLESGSELIMAETVCAGRIGHGEEFQFESWRNRVHVYLDNELIFVNQTHAQPQKLGTSRIGAWQNYTHQTSFCLFSPRADVALRDKLREVLEDLSGNQKHAVWGGVSLLDHYGLVVNLMGHRAHDLQSVVQCLRKITLLHRSPLL